MRKFALTLYETMRQELEECQHSEGEGERRIEQCHNICCNQWNRLRKIMLLHQFSSEEEEIDFFKNIKPLFTSEIEYYNLLFHAELFKPLLDPLEIQKFWQREAGRLDRFSEENVAFIQYIQHPDQCRDEDYFLRKYFRASSDQDLGPFEKDMTTNGDALMAQFLSLKKYTDYVRSELDKNATGNGL